MNMHLEKLLEKANKEKKMLQHMAYHYLALLALLHATDFPGEGISLVLGC